MRNIRERNLQILRLSREGRRHRDIADLFGIVSSNVDGIVRRLRAAEELARKITLLREEMARADDLDREWPTSDLLDAIQPLTAARKALLGYFEAQSAATISLRTLMDLAIFEVEDPTAPYRITKLLQLRHIGQKGFRSVIRGMSRLIDGKRCRREWEQRLNTLRRVWGMDDECSPSHAGKHLHEEPQSESSRS